MIVVFPDHSHYFGLRGGIDNKNTFSHLVPKKSYLYVYDYLKLMYVKMPCAVCCAGVVS